MLRSPLFAWLAVLAACDGDPTPAGTDTDADSDTDTDADSDADTDADSDADTDADTEVEVALLQVEVAPYGDPADLFYPTDPIFDPLPTVVFLQGADVERIHYREFASRLASRGYAVLVSDHERNVLLFSGLYPEVGQIDAGLATTAAESARSGSPLFGRIDPDRAAVAGHSLGGVAAIEGIAGVCSSFLCTGSSYERPAAIRAAVTYASNRKPPIGGIPDTDNDGLPMMLVQGSADGAASPEDTLTTWEQIADPPKVLLLLDGANHYSITDEQNPPGALPDNSEATLDQMLGIEHLSDWFATFLDAFVREDASALGSFPAGSSEPASGLSLAVEVGR